MPKTLEGGGGGGGGGGGESTRGKFPLSLEGSPPKKL